MKFVSIPRLEFQAAVLATRMFKMNISRTCLWTDSEIVLHYLRNAKRRLQTFVPPQVQNGLAPSFVQFVEGKQNAKTGRLTVDDFDAATVAVVRIVQRLAYGQEIKDLKSNGAVKPSSKVTSLNPKLDKGGILRVNGCGQLKPTP